MLITYLFEKYFFGLRYVYFLVYLWNILTSYENISRYVSYLN